MFSSLPHYNSEFIPATAQPSHSGDEEKALRLLSSLCGRKGLAAVQGREDASVDVDVTATCRGSWSESGPCTASPQEAPYRGASLFLGTEPLGWKTQEAGEFSAPCKSFFLLSLADTCFLPRLIPASVEGIPSPHPPIAWSGSWRKAGLIRDRQHPQVSWQLLPPRTRSILSLPHTPQRYLHPLPSSPALEGIRAGTEIDSR